MAMENPATKTPVIQIMVNHFQGANRNVGVFGVILPSLYSFKIMKSQNPGLKIVPNSTETSEKSSKETPKESVHHSTQEPSQGTSSGNIIEKAPSKIRWLLFYVLATLSIPLAGIGIWNLRVLETHRKSHRIRLTETSLEVGVDAAQRLLPWDRLDAIHLEKDDSWLGWFGWQMIRLDAGAGPVVLRGFWGMKALADEMTLRRDHAQAQRTSSTQSRPSGTQPGTTEQVNELAFLWQQGLLTEQEYRQQVASIKNEAK